MAVHRLMLFAILLGCLALGAQAWASTYSFNGTSGGQGLESFTPGTGHALSIGAGNGGNGALVTDFVDSFGLCGGDCSIMSGYVTLTTGGQNSAFTNGSLFAYGFGAGGSMEVFGKIPSLGINSVTLLFSASFLPGGSFTGSGHIGTLAADINPSTIVLNAALGGHGTTIAGSATDLSFTVPLTCMMGGSCSGGSIANSTNQFTIPEPATLSVLGIGLFAFGAGLRRRMANRSTP